MRDALDELLSRTTLLAIAAGIALAYAVYDVAQGVSTVVLSAFADDEFASTGSLLSLEVGGRVLQFAQLLSGLVTLTVVLAAILYVVRPDLRPYEEAPDEVA